MAKGKYEYWISPDGVLLLEGWARDGLTEEQIAKNIGINRGTLQRWKAKHSVIRDAIKKNKAIADYEVENALYNKCVGTWVTEEKPIKCKRVFYDDAGHRCEEETVQVVEVRTFVPPDTVAQLAWLNNRRPDKYRRNANKERLDEEKFEHEKAIDNKRFW